MQIEIQAILSHTLPPEQHARVQLKYGANAGYNIYSRKSPPIQRLFRKKHLTFDQMLAGERLESLAYTSGIYAPSAMVLGERVGGSGERKMSERQLEAWQEYFRACKEIHRTLGSEVQQTVIQVAVYGYSPMETRMVAVNRRMDAVRDGLQIAHDFLFTPRDVTATLSA